MSLTMSLPQAKFLLLAFATMVLMYLLQPSGLVMDEAIAHTPQINSILAGNTDHLSNITTFIFVHHVYAFIIDVVGINEPIDYRWLNFAVITLLIFTLSHICKAKHYRFPALMAAQLFFLPIAFPYYPLIYTDIIALFFMYWAYHYYRLSWHLLAAVLIAAAVLVRQPSLVWLGCFAMMTFFSQLEISSNKITLKQIMTALFRIWPYILVTLAFLLYFYLNKGIALGDKALHQVSLNITNFYFMLVVFFLVFFPLLLSRFKQVIGLFKKYQWLWVILVLYFALYMSTFKVTHHYNDESLNMFLRNWLVNYIEQNSWFKVLTFLTSTYGVLAITSIGFKKTIYNWLYVFIPLSVVAMPLIEQRYYMVGMAFWQLSRISLSKPIEQLQLIWMIAFAWLLYIGLANNWFLL